MNPYRSTEENMSALKKVLTQRTLVAIANKNVEFVLKNQNASLDELAEYLCKCRRWCGHIPGRTEVIGGDYIELRFRGWASGVSKELAVKRFHPALEKTMLFQQEYERQREQDILEKRQKKVANKEKMRQEKSERKQPKKTAPPSGTAGDGGAAE